MSLANLLVLNLVLIAAILLALWLVSLPLRNASIVDIFWGIGFVVITWVSFIASGSMSSRGLLVCSAAGGGWWTIFSPVVMSVLLMRVSGVTLLKRSLKDRRPGYKEYAARTSTFFPWPPTQGPFREIP